MVIENALILLVLVINEVSDRTGLQTIVGDLLMLNL
jgi:hypothetical protein